MELNDIVEWRGNYYHLRAINDYNLKNGECSIQLLGPVINDVIANVLPGVQCDFEFEIDNPPTPTSSLWDLTSCDGITTFSGVSFDTTSSLNPGQVIKWGTPEEFTDCYTLATSSASPDLTGSIVYAIFDNCTDASDHGLTGAFLFFVPTEDAYCSSSTSPYRNATEETKTNTKKLCCIIS